jgi:hypothetical protein
MPAPTTPPSMMPMHAQSTAQPFAGGVAYARSGAAQAVPMQVRMDAGVPITPVPRDASPVTPRNDAAGIAPPRLDGAVTGVPRSDGGLR